MTQRSTTVGEYCKLYFTKKWRTLRGIILTRDQYQCQRSRVILTGRRFDPRSATVHHRHTHKGDMTLFYDTENLEANCWSCPSGVIQSAEAIGYDKQVGDKGWPIDPKHPMVR